MPMKKTERKYQLLITYNIVSKSKRYYYIFKPKEIINTEPCKITFNIKNIGKKTFPGGQITQLRIFHIKSKEGMKYYENENEIPGNRIPKIPPNESHTTTELKYIPINYGSTWFDLLIIPKDNEKIEYYQLEEARKNKASLGNSNTWTDYFYVTSKNEVQQKYVSYLLLLLSFITIILLIISLTR